LRTVPKYLISEKKLEIETMKTLCKQLSLASLNNLNMELNSVEKILELLDPTKVLRRGYSIVRSEGKYITSSKSIKKSGQELDIEFKDGRIKVNTK
jgi:exodeoxyribonuclease VII large subunit